MNYQGGGRFELPRWLVIGFAMRRLRPLGQPPLKCAPGDSNPFTFRHCFTGSLALPGRDARMCYSFVWTAFAVVIAVSRHGHIPPFSLDSIPLTGFEPAWVTPIPFEGTASASFATAAYHSDTVGEI